MKTFWTKKNIAIVLAVLLVAAVVVLCIALRQKSVEDTEPTLTLTCQSADADGTCTVDVVLSGLPDGAHYEAASLAVAFDPTQITFLGTADGDIPLVMGSLPEWESDSERANETGSARALCLPETIGSTTGGMVLYTACASGQQPACMLFSKHIDSLAASGAILASVWTDADMPVIDCLGDEFLAAVQTGQTVRVLDGGIVEVA